MSGANLVNEFSETSFLSPSSKNTYGWNANRTGTEQHRTDTERERNGYRTDIEQIQNGYRTDTERIQNGYRTRTGTRVERKQNAFGQAFPVRFLIGTETCTIISKIVFSMS